MAGLVKLLNAQAAGVTGLGIRLGMAQPPFSIRTQGTYTLGAGAAGTQGVNIESSYDSTNGVDGTWAREIGTKGGQNDASDVQTAELVDLPSLDTAIITHTMRWIRATTGAGMNGSATVFMEAPR